MKLLKLLVIPVLVVSLVLSIALPALANSRVAATQSVQTLAAEKDKPNKPDQATRVVKGEVTAIAGNIITVNGKQVAVSADTKFKVAGQKDATLADIKVGMDIIAQGHEVDGKLEARQIIVLPRPVVKATHTGNVTAFSYDATVGGNITILDKAGKTFSFDILAGKLNVRPKDAVVKVGQIVTITARPLTNIAARPVAALIVVHPAPLQYVSGTINAVTDTTITIGTTVLKWDDKTVFALRGKLSVQVGQQANAIYRDVDGTLTTKRVLVGIELPKPKPATAAKKVK